MRWALVQGHADSWCSVSPRCFLIIEATFDSLKPLTQVAGGSGRGCFSALLVLC